MYLSVQRQMAIVSLQHGDSKLRNQTELSTLDSALPHGIDCKAVPHSSQYSVPMRWLLAVIFALAIPASGYAAGRRSALYNFNACLHAMGAAGRRSSALDGL